MYETARLQRQHLAFLFDPQTRFDAFADMSEFDSRHGLFSDEPPAGARIKSQDQLKLFTVKKSVLQRTQVSSRLEGSGGKRYRWGAEHGSAAAFRAEVRKIRCQSVTDIDHGVDFSLFGQTPCLVDSWHEAQMAAQDTAADRPCQ